MNSLIYIYDYLKVHNKGYLKDLIKVIDIRKGRNKKISELFIFNSLHTL
jgi:hypothetical protein